MDTVRALLIEKSEAVQTAAFKNIDATSSGDGNVVLRVTHSSLSYKDALALTGRPGVIRKFPVIPGIDCAGVVEESADTKFKVIQNPKTKPSRT